MVLPLDSEQMHDVVLAAELALELLTVDSDELLFIDLGLHWLLILLLLLSVQVLTSWPLA